MSHNFVSREANRDKRKQIQIVFVYHEKQILFTSQIFLFLLPFHVIPLKVWWEKDTRHLFALCCLFRASSSFIHCACTDIIFLLKCYSHTTAKHYSEKTDLDNFLSCYETLNLNRAETPVVFIHHDRGLDVMYLEQFASFCTIKFTLIPVTEGQFFKSVSLPSEIS